MQDGQSDQFAQLGSAANVSRRTMVSLAAKFVGGAALSVIAVARLAHVAAADPGSKGGGHRLAQGAAAQDDEIILTAAASEVGARPGSAYAQGYAALAAADQDAGAITEPATSPAGAPSGGGAPVAVVPGSKGGGH